MGIITPVWLFMSCCTVYDASTYVNILYRLVAPEYLFTLRVQWTNLNILLNVYHSSTSLFDTSVAKKPTAVSKSGLDPFTINNNFSTTECNHSTFFSLSCLEYYLTLDNLFVAGYVTKVLTYSPNISMHSSNCSTILTCIVLLFISILTPKKVCLLPITTDISSKCLFT